MNKQQIVIGVGAIILTVTAVFASKATKQIATGVYYKTVFGRCKCLTSTINAVYFSTTIGTNQAEIVTLGGTHEKLFATSACIVFNSLYFRGY
jgi:hypothetical protein